MCHERLFPLTHTGVVSCCLSVLCPSCSPSTPAFTTPCYRQVVHRCQVLLWGRTLPSPGVSRAPLSKATNKLEAELWLSWQRAVALMPYMPTKSGGGAGTTTSNAPYNAGEGYGYSVPPSPQGGGVGGGAGGGAGAVELPLETRARVKSLVGSRTAKHVLHSTKRRRQAGSITSTLIAGRLQAA